MKGLLRELLSLETCVVVFPTGLLSMKLAVIQSDRIIIVTVSFFQMVCDYVMNHLYRE